MCATPCPLRKPLRFCRRMDTRRRMRREASRSRDPVSPRNRVSAAGFRSLSTPLVPTDDHALPLLPFFVVLQRPHPEGFGGPPLFALGAFGSPLLDVLLDIPIAHLALVGLEGRRFDVNRLVNRDVRVAVAKGRAIHLADFVRGEALGG